MWAAALRQAKRVTLQRVSAHSHVRLQSFHTARSCICASSHQNVSVASLKSNEEKAKAGIEPIDTDGAIDLVDESNEQPDSSASQAIASRSSGSGKKRATEQNVEVTDEDELFTARIHTKPQSPASAAATAAAATRLLKSKPARSNTESLRDDLIRPPTLPASTTHSSWTGPSAIGKGSSSSFDASVSSRQSTWKAASFRNSNERAVSESTNSSSSSSSGWGSQQQWAPEQREEAAKFEAAARASKLGWAQAKRAAAAAQKHSSNEAQQSDIKNAEQSGEMPAWTDADYLLLFPHLKYIREASVSEQQSVSTAETTSTIVPQGMRAASPEEVQTNLAEMRRRFPELERLHVASTWIKIRKWREMMGATKLQPHESNGNSSNETSDATAENADATTAEASSSASATSSPSALSNLPSNFPANALHLRYYQPDVYMSNEEISLMLSREMELLYSSIEGLIVPRLNILRTHLPGLNIRALLLRHPAVLLMDLQGSLPTKLKELKQIFPEINLTTLLEKEPKILHHAVTSYIIPRLNLFRAATDFSPEHVIEFFAVEFPQALLVRWNRLKRVEIVKLPQFWTWWNEGEAVKVGRTDFLPIPTNQANQLPFTFFNDIISMTNEKFQETFPFYEIQVSPVEQELLQLRNQSHKSRTDRDAPSREKAASSLGSLPVSVLSTVPGNPQSITLALGANDKAHLTRDELKARQRMDYLDLKQRKAEKRATERDAMREREAAFNRDKMAAYTQKFQAHRRKVLEPYQHAQDEARQQQELQYKPPPAPQQDSRGADRDLARGAAGHRNQKNRAGPAISNRHFSHAPGMIEQAGVEPLHSTFEQPPPPPPPAQASSSASSSFSFPKPARAHSAPPPFNRDNNINNRDRKSAPVASAAPARTSEYKFGQSFLVAKKESSASPPVYDSPFPPTPRPPAYEKFEKSNSFEKPASKRPFDSNRRFDSREGGREGGRDSFSKSRPFESRGSSKFGGSGRPERSSSADGSRKSFRESRGGSYGARRRDASKSYDDYTLSKPSTKKPSAPRARK